MAFLLVGVGCSDSGHNGTTSTSVTNPDPSTFTPVGTVNGVLTDTVTQVPLAGAVVSLLGMKATTDAEGGFQLLNVPASTAIGAASTDGITPAQPPSSLPVYPVVIDMTAVNKGLAKGVAPYPTYVYDTVMVAYTSLGDATDKTASNHATPVDGFVANITPSVAKTDANLAIQIVTAAQVPAAKATASLYADTTTDRDGLVTSSGNQNLVGTAVADANGMVTFSGLEALRNFTLKATSADGAQVGQGTFTAGTDLTTTTYPWTNSEVDENGVQLAPTNTVAPFLSATIPAAGADIAPGATSVVYTFNEPIAATPYSLAISQDLATNAGLFNDISVNYKGTKGGNIPFTLTWDAAMTTLTVALNTVAASSYDVDLTDAIVNLVSAANPGAAGTDQGIGLANVPFTTSGGVTPATPELALTLETWTGYDYGNFIAKGHPAGSFGPKALPGPSGASGGTGYVDPNLQLNWLSTLNTLQFAVLSQMYVNGILVSDYNYNTYPTTSSTMFNFGDTTVPKSQFEGFFNTSDLSAQLPYSYKVKVVAMSTGTVLTPGLATDSSVAVSNEITIVDTTKPLFSMMTTWAVDSNGNSYGSPVWPTLPTFSATEPNTYGATVQFSKNMLLSDLTNVANWSFFEGADYTADLKSAQVEDATLVDPVSKGAFKVTQVQLQTDPTVDSLVAYVYFTVTNPDLTSKAASATNWYGASGSSTANAFEYLCLAYAGHDIATAGNACGNYMEFSNGYYGNPVTK